MLVDRADEYGILKLLTFFDIIIVVLLFDTTKFSGLNFKLDDGLYWLNQQVAY